MKISRWFHRSFPAPQSASRRKRTAPRSHQPAWVELLESRMLLSAQQLLTASLGTLPGTTFDDVAVQFDLTQGRANFAEMGVFVFDGDGTVGGLTPGSNGFEQAVLNLANRRVLFAQGMPAGDSASVTFNGGSQIGIYFLPNTPANGSAARVDVQMTSANSLRIGFEETPSLWPAVNLLTGAQPRQFDDAVIQVTLGDSVRFPVPILDPIADRTIPERVLFQLALSAQNPAGPPGDLRFQLDSAPEGVAIDPLTGLLSWTPTEAQGPGRYDILVRVFNVNRPESFTTRQFTINVTEVNTPPTLLPIPPQQVRQLEELSFRVIASDSDLPIIPTNRFTFSLDDNGVAGAMIDPVTGVFTWTPTLADLPGTYLFTVRVVDNGSPPLGAAQTFMVRVNPAG